MLKINVPEPSRRTSNREIDRIALECNLLYRAKCRNKQGFPVDVEHFADAVLEISVVQTHFDAPPGGVAYARCKRDERNPSRFVIEFNENHQKHFAEKPESQRAVGSHEVGHIVLKHHDQFTNNSTKSLFDDFAPEPKFLHRAGWSHHGLSDDELKDLCEMALEGDERVRNFLHSLNDCFEEEWMFWQAEHFALCFLIPQDSVMNLLNSDFNVTDWRAIYNRAKEFGVSGSMLATRLKKLNAIEIHGKQIVLGGFLKQRRLSGEQVL
jgi:hypothetical protein